MRDMEEEEERRGKKETNRTKGVKRVRGMAHVQVKRAKKEKKKKKNSTTTELLRARGETGKPQVSKEYKRRNREWKKHRNADKAVPCERSSHGMACGWGRGCFIVF